MTSNKPYLLRAFYDWIIDNECAPILVIDAHHPACQYLQGHAEEGEVVFNIAGAAVRDLQLSNELVEFKASFSGVINFITVPIEAVVALYAEENGEGIFFDGEQDGGESGGNETTRQMMHSNSVNVELVSESSVASPVNPGKRKPNLRLVD